MLFSEPKIPQSSLGAALIDGIRSFSALQRAENSSIEVGFSREELIFGFSALQRAENSSIRCRNAVRRAYRSGFSALQRAENSSIFRRVRPPSAPHTRFSALQRAENSSIQQALDAMTELVKFQCSSASRKFLNRCCDAQRTTRARRFSALQRAENSSIDYPNIVVIKSPKFQCSSASRKFLNQRQFRSVRAQHQVSVLFSEPKIPQSAEASGLVAPQREFQCSSASRKFLNAAGGARRLGRGSVSVLFSEPKIPQLLTRDAVTQPPPACFSALQRAENSSIRSVRNSSERARKFQCSSASRKFLNPTKPPCSVFELSVSVLFSEPKIPQCSASRRWKMQRLQVSVLFSEPKIPQWAIRRMSAISSACFSALQRAENSSINSADG